MIDGWKEAVPGIAWVHKSQRAMVSRGDGLFTGSMLQVYVRAEGPCEEPGMAEFLAERTFSTGSLVMHLFECEAFEDAARCALDLAEAVHGVPV